MPLLSDSIKYEYKLYTKKNKKLTNTMQCRQIAFYKLFNVEQFLIGFIIIDFCTLCTYFAALIGIQGLYFGII